MTKIKRKNADSTREKIIAAASNLFAEKGYSGTAMQTIADRAKVNQALLYHHFGNKQALWKTVKQYFVDHTQQQLTAINHNSNSNLESVLTHIIEQRFALYQRQPNLVRMMLWQQLEPEQQELLGGTSSSPDQWLTTFQALQERGLIRADLNPELIMLWIASSVSGPVLAKVDALKAKPELQTAYKDMLLKGFLMLLSPREQSS